jgi:hypothetical protein
VTVYSNDPKTPQLVLSLAGEVIADVDPQPRRLSFGQVSKRAEASRELTLQVPKPDEIKISSVTIDDERFEIKLVSGEPAGTAKYEVRFKGSEALGRITGRVRVAFSGSDVTEIDIPLWGEIVGDLRYAKNLSFYKQKGAFKPRKLTFTSRTKKPVEILDAKDEGGHLKVKIVKAKGELAELEVSVAGAAQQADKTSKGKLRVKTTDRDEPEVVIAYGIYPADRIKSMQKKLRKAPKPAKPKPSASAR